MKTRINKRIYINTAACSPKGKRRVTSQCPECSAFFDPSDIVINIISHPEESFLLETGMCNACYEYLV